MQDSVFVYLQLVVPCDYWLHYWVWSEKLFRLLSLTVKGLTAWSK